MDPVGAPGDRDAVALMAGRGGYIVAYDDHAAGFAITRASRLPVRPAPRDTRTVVPLCMSMVWLRVTPC